MRLAIIALLPFIETTLFAQPTIKFADRTDEANLSVVTYSGGVEKNHILESTGNGVLAFDYDLDGDLDLYLVNAYWLPEPGKTEPHANVLYRNKGDGTFEDVTAAAGVGAAFYGHGGCVGDVDADGLPDMYVTNYGPNILYRNNGDGTFSDITEQAGVGDPKYSIGAAFFDADEDGDHDLFVANYLDTNWEEVYAARRTRQWKGMVEVLDGPKGLRPSANTFYYNNGDGTFTEATEKAGFDAGGNIYAMGVMTFDYDNDGDVDLYVAGDSSPNCLYQNQGNGTFEEVGTRTGAGYTADGNTQGSMGVNFGDYNGDGWFDIIVTNFANDYYTLYQNLNGMLFIDSSFAVGLAVPTFVPLGWVPLLVDFDHDRDLDLFFSNGHIYPQVDNDPAVHESYKQKNQLFVNDNGKYTEISEQAGEVFSIVESSRGGACADLDNDGDLDIVVSNQDAKPTYYENRTETDNHWITVQVVDNRHSPLALGARVEVVTGGLVQMREVSSGATYASQSDFRANFGLGDSSTVDELRVTWPDGAREVHKDLNADRFYIVKRGRPPSEMAFAH
jgi:hypothetical protein